MGNAKRRTKSSFGGIPRQVMDSEDYKSLSGNAVKLLMELCRQYRGKNNGDLTAAFSVVKNTAGFRSRTTVEKARDELLEKRMIITSRQGRFANPGGVCSLYALTWAPVNECLGKLDIEATATPPRKFSLEGKTKCPV